MRRRDNLVQNAQKFAAESHEIVVRVLRDERSATATVEVADHGPGIAPEDHGVLFTRFFQASRGKTAPSKSGLGLGLFISKGIVEQHGGTIAVSSSSKSGTKFSVRLPVEPLERH